MFCLKPSKTFAWYLVICSALCFTQLTLAQTNVVTFVIDGNLTQPTAINDQGVVIGALGGYEISPVWTFVRSPDGQASWFQVQVGTCPTGAQITSGNDINNLGMIIGNTECMTEEGAFAYLRLPSGEIVHLTDPLGWVRPLGINDRGDIVGTVRNFSSGLESGFVRDIAGQTTYLSYGTSTVSPVAINNHRVIVGTINDSGFVYRHGKFKIVNYTVQGQKTTTVFLDINDRGDILGYYLQATSTTRHTFVLHGAKFKSLTLPPNSIATRFNSEGDVVGIVSRDEPPCCIGFISYGLAQSRAGHD